VLTNIELVLDVSGSMSSPIGYAKAGASRYTAAMDAINVFTSRRKGDALGLTIFGGEVVRWVPLTKDLSAIRNATPFLDPATMPGPLNSTRVGHALDFTREVLAKQQDGDRLIILITDGFSSDLEGPNAAAVASALRAERIVVHAINVGDGPAPDQLFDVVLPTGGRVFDARDQRSLATIFEHIDQMHPVRIKPKEREPVDFFTPIAVAAAGLLGVHGLCLLGFRYTPW
jgi:Ca-activated chloride channel family protein